MPYNALPTHHFFIRINCCLCFLRRVLGLCCIIEIGSWLSTVPITGITNVHRNFNLSHNAHEQTFVIVFNSTVFANSSFSRAFRKLSRTHAQVFDHAVSCELSPFSTSFTVRMRKLLKSQGERKAHGSWDHSFHTAEWNLSIGSGSQSRYLKYKKYNY